MGAEYCLTTGNIVLSGRQLQPASNLQPGVHSGSYPVYIVVIGLLRRAQPVDVEPLATRKSVSSRCAVNTTGDRH
ncbi:hypothetical protein ACLK1Z_19470 [Escherichia coli]